MKRKGERVITLSLGEAFFDVPFYGLDGDMFRPGGVPVFIPSV